MPSTIVRNINLCFDKIKRPALLPSPLQDDPTRPLPTTSIHDPSSILFKSFNSLFDPSSNSSSSDVHHHHHHHQLYPDIENAAAAADPDFATVLSSNRFFFSSPGRSNSIIESSSSLYSPSSLASTSSSSPGNPTPESDAAFLGGGIAAVPTMSPDPYMDFRRSMQEMVEARGGDVLIDVGTNWEYLHELLMCYLSLNPKTTHKFIVGAFADLLVTLMASPACRKS